MADFRHTFRGAEGCIVAAMTAYRHDVHGGSATGKHEHTDVEGGLGGSTTERFLRRVTSDLQVGFCCATTIIVGYRNVGSQEEVGP